MNDSVTFQVAGAELLGTLDYLRTLIPGIPVELKPDPNETYPNRVLISVDGKDVGFVPDRGTICTNCWSAVSSKDKKCEFCGTSNYFFIKGGLATRLIQGKLLTEDTVAYIEEIDPFQYGIARIKLVF